MYELQCKQKGVVSLWYWSHKLEMKVLRAWQVYTANKRRKTDRYAQAMERHRKELLRLGVTQWIRVSLVAVRHAGQGERLREGVNLQVAAELRAERLEEAVNIQTKVA